MAFIVLHPVDSCTIDDIFTNMNMSIWIDGIVFWQHCFSDQTSKIFGYETFRIDYFKSGRLFSILKAVNLNEMNLLWPYWLILMKINRILEWDMEFDLAKSGKWWQCDFNAILSVIFFIQWFDIKLNIIQLEIFVFIKIHVRHHGTITCHLNSTPVHFKFDTSWCLNINFFESLNVHKKSL